jgi:GNAT superfamily N-acetyltransferase
MAASAPFMLVGADTLAPADLHAATVAAFADYLVGPFQMTLQQYGSFIGRQGVDLARSRAAVQADTGAIGAFAFVCPRADTGRWRLGVMGALPAARGTGAAPALLDDFIARAKAEGLPWVELECFAGNERALRLYRSRGFEAVCALNGWKAPDDAAPATAAATGVRPVDRATAFAWLAEADVRLADMPFPNTDRSLSAQERPLAFWQCGGAQLVFSVLEGTPTQVHSLIDHDPALRDAETLAHALRAAHPDAFAPPILRDDLGGEALRRAGFAPHGMSQVLMKRKL